ncbi:hypothetical protein HanXRQr2_Chr14g0658231 [Helianthus annuus]|uniref:Uncharacterized protein n=2 Tax=Helianthus annuus TaxID=4232 RepID=A0A9K3ED87_HELAN|nr:hypothetical protein HanXRQr2_Chr14g0658231 [Helianthus annuus]
MSPHVEQLLDTHPYLRDVIVPVGGTIVGTFAAWACCRESLEGFTSTQRKGQVRSYQQDRCGVRGVVVAPTTIASQFIGPAWKGAVIISFVWFLHRWKTNVITRALVMKYVEGVDCDKLLTLDKFSSVGVLNMKVSLRRSMGKNVINIQNLTKTCGHKLRARRKEKCTGYAMIVVCVHRREDPEIEKLNLVIKELVKEKDEEKEKERFNGIIAGLLADKEKDKVD